MEMRQTAPRKGLHGLHPGWLARHQDQQTQGSGKLQVVVRLEPDHPAACTPWSRAAFSPLRRIR